MLGNIGKTLLTYKFLMIALALAAIAFAIFWIADTQLANPRLAEIFRTLGTAILTSAIVSFTFEYLTRTEFAGMMQDIVRTQLTEYEDRLWTKQTATNTTAAFWKPFITEDTRIIVAQNEQGEEPTIRSADMIPALTLYQELTQRYATIVGSLCSFQISIDTLNKYKPLTRDLPFAKNLIVIAGPGANPLTNHLMADSKGIDPQGGSVTHGYVFGISRRRIDRYLPSPFIIPVEDDEEGILDLAAGKIRARYQSYVAPTRAGASEDCCLLILGAINDVHGHPHRTLVIAGYSRFATAVGIYFALANADWTKAVLEMSDAGTVGIESVLAIRYSGIHRDREVRIAQSPRPVFRQGARGQDNID